VTLIPPPQPKTALEFFEQSDELPEFPLLIGSDVSYDATGNPINYGYLQVIYTSNASQKISEFLKELDNINNIIDYYMFEEPGFNNLSDEAKRIFWDIAGVIDMVGHISCGKSLVEIRYEIIYDSEDDLQQEQLVFDVGKLCIDASSGDIHDCAADEIDVESESAADEETLALAQLLLAQKHLRGIQQDNLIGSLEQRMLAGTQAEKIRKFLDSYSEQHWLDLRYLY